MAAGGIAAERLRQLFEKEMVPHALQADRLEIAPRRSPAVHAQPPFRAAHGNARGCRRLGGLWSLQHSAHELDIPLRVFRRDGGTVGTRLALAQYLPEKSTGERRL